MIISQTALTHTATGHILAASGGRHMVETIQEGLLNLSDIAGTLLEIPGISRTELHSVEIQLSRNRLRSAITLFFDSTEKLLLDGFIRKHQPMGKEDLRVFYPELFRRITSQRFQLMIQLLQGLAKTRSFMSAIIMQYRIATGGLPLIEAGPADGNARRQRGTFQ
jgi:hypothetical protein